MSRRKYMYRVRYWVQRTMETGQWGTTELLDKETADIVAERFSSQYERVSVELDEEEAYRYGVRSNTMVLPTAPKNRTKKGRP